MSASMAFPPPMVAFQQAFHYSSGLSPMPRPKRAAKDDAPRIPLGSPDFSEVTLDGSAMRAARVELLLSLAEVASELGISPSTLSRIERGAASGDPASERVVYERLRQRRILGEHTARYLQPRATSHPDPRSEFFADPGTGMEEVSKQIFNALEVSFSVMDERGTLLQGAAWESPSDREKHRVMRLHTCGVFRSALHKPESPFGMVADDLNSKPLHPCNLHDSQLIKCALRLGHVAFSRCPSGLLAAILPFKMSQAVTIDAATRSPRHDVLLESIDFEFGVPIAQVSYRPPSQHDTADVTAERLKQFFKDLAIPEEFVDRVDAELVQAVRDDLQKPDYLRHLQHRSLSNFDQLQSAIAERPSWGSFYKTDPISLRASLENWVRYQLSCLLMEDPLLNPEKLDRSRDEISSIVFGDGHGGGDKRLDDQLGPYSVQWLADQHRTTVRSIVLAFMQDTPAPERRRSMTLDTILKDIKVARVLVDGWLDRAVPRWIRRMAQGNSELQELLPVLR